MGRPQPGWRTPIDAITLQRGIGFDGARYINLVKVTHETLKAWAEALTLTEGARGILVNANNALGRDLLVAFGIPDTSPTHGW